MRWAFPWREAGVAGAVAVLAGVLAQALPASRAARMSPVDALVDE
jgi:ABC-type antimicrobial peptide transport system permease subunit